MGIQNQSIPTVETRIVPPRFGTVTEQMQQIEHMIFELQNLSDALEFAVDEISCIDIQGSEQNRKRVSALIGIRDATAEKIESLNRLLC